MDGFYTSIYFQRYKEHPNRSFYDKVMVLRSWSKNRDCSNVTTLRTNVATLLHDVARSGLVLGVLLAHFEPIMEGF